MFSTIHDGASAAVFRAANYASHTVAGAHDNAVLQGLVRVFAAPNVIAAPNAGVVGTGAVKANCTDAFFTAIQGGLSVIIKVLLGLGIAVSVIGILVGGLMRATSWGSEQRIATSNKAIQTAIVGLIIVLLAVTLGGALPNWFSGGTSCGLT